MIETICDKTSRMLSRLKKSIRKRYSIALGLLHKPLVENRTSDPFHTAWKMFVDMANNIPRAKVLEMGAGMLENSTCKRELFSNCETYIGFDIHAGRNIDVVGDAHCLSRYFASDSFDVVFSISVFEHLIMPWKVALEINKVLKTGGIVAITSHPAWPPHELPWDFWRFQSNSFISLFNKHTGFEILNSTEGVPGRLYCLTKAPRIGDLYRHPIYLGVVVIARKTHDYDSDALRWDVDVRDITDTMYPFHHL